MVGPAPGVGLPPTRTAVDGASRSAKPNIAITCRPKNGGAGQMGAGGAGLRAWPSAWSPEPIVVCSNSPRRSCRTSDLATMAARDQARKCYRVLRLSGYGRMDPGRPNHGVRRGSRGAAAGEQAVQGDDGDPPVRVGSGSSTRPAAGALCTRPWRSSAEIEAPRRPARVVVSWRIGAETVHSVFSALSSGETARGGRLLPPHGNRDRNAATRRGLRARGEERWIADLGHRRIWLRRPWRHGSTTNLRSRNWHRWRTGTRLS